MEKLQKSINFFVGKLSPFFSLVKRYDMYILAELLFSSTNSPRSIISGSLAIIREEGYSHLTYYAANIRFFAEFIFRIKP